MDRQCSGQIKKNALQNATLQTVDLATATSLTRIMNSGMQLRWSCDSSYTSGDK